MLFVIRDSCKPSCLRFKSCGIQWQLGVNSLYSVGHVSSLAGQGLQEFRAVKRCNMAVITIPFGYSDTSHPGVVPICIMDTDAYGNPIYREWVEHGVVPVTKNLLRIAERLLHDKFRASEITEYAVHSLSRTHGNQIGDRPTIKVLNSARLRAVDLRYGGRRSRRQLDVELFAETLDALEDRTDFAAALEARDTLDRIMEEVERLGLQRVKELLPLMLRNAEGNELTAIFGQKRNTITKRFYRGMRKAASAAGISWD